MLTSSAGAMKPRLKRSLTQRQSKKLRQLFDEHDQGGKNYLSFEEFKSLMGSQGKDISVEKAQAIITTHAREHHSEHFGEEGFVEEDVEHITFELFCSLVQTAASQRATKQKTEAKTLVAEKKLTELDTIPKEEGNANAFAEKKEDGNDMPPTKLEFTFEEGESLKIEIGKYVKYASNPEDLGKSFNSWDKDEGGVVIRTIKSDSKVPASMKWYRIVSVFCKEDKASFVDTTHVSSVEEATRIVKDCPRPLTMRLAPEKPPSKRAESKDTPSSKSLDSSENLKVTVSAPGELGIKFKDISTSSQGVCLAIKSIEPTSPVLSETITEEQLMGRALIMIGSRDLVAERIDADKTLELLREALENRPCDLCLGPSRFLRASEEKDDRKDSQISEEGKTKRKIGTDLSQSKDDRKREESAASEQDISSVEESEGERVLKEKLERQKLKCQRLAEKSERLENMLRTKDAEMSRLQSQQRNSTPVRPKEEKRRKENSPLITRVDREKGGLFGTPPPINKHRPQKAFQTAGSAPLRGSFSDFPPATANTLTAMLPLPACAGIASKLSIRITRASGLKDPNPEEQFPEDVGQKDGKDKTHNASASQLAQFEVFVEVRLNGRTLLRSSPASGKHGDPSWNETHDIWIDRRIDLRESVLSFWLCKANANNSREGEVLGVVKMQKDLMVALLRNKGNIADKSRPLREPSRRGKLGAKTEAGSLMVGFSAIDIPDYDDLEYQQQHGRSDRLGSGLRKPACFLFREDQARLDRLRSMSGKDQGKVLDLMKKLLFEMCEEDEFGESTLRANKAGTDKYYKGNISDDIQKKTAFCDAFDRAVARAGVKGGPPPKLIMRHFSGSARKILLQLHRGSSLEGMDDVLAKRLLALEKGDLEKLLRETQEHLTTEQTALSALNLGLAKYHKVKMLRAKRPVGGIVKSKGPRLARLKKGELKERRGRTLTVAEMKNHRLEMERKKKKKKRAGKRKIHEKVSKQEVEKRKEDTMGGGGGGGAYNYDDTYEAQQEYDESYEEMQMEQKQRLQQMHETSELNYQNLQPWQEQPPGYDGDQGYEDYNDNGENGEYGEYGNQMDYYDYNEHLYNDRYQINQECEDNFDHQNFVEQEEDFENFEDYYGDEQDQYSEDPIIGELDELGKRVHTKKKKPTRCQAPLGGINGFDLEATPDLAFVQQHHSSYFVSTLPNSNFSGILVYEGGVPTQTYNDGEIGDTEDLKEMLAVQNLAKMNQGVAKQRLSKEGGGFLPALKPSRDHSMQLQSENQEVGDEESAMREEGRLRSSDGFEPPSDDFSGVVVYEGGVPREVHEETTYSSSARITDNILKRKPNTVDAELTKRVFNQRVDAMSHPEKEFPEFGSVRAAEVAREFPLPKGYDDLLSMRSGQLM